MPQFSSFMEAVLRPAQVHVYGVYDPNFFSGTFLHAFLSVESWMVNDHILPMNVPTIIGTLLDHSTFGIDTTTSKINRYFNILFVCNDGPGGRNIQRLQIRIIDPGTKIKSMEPITRWCYDS